MLEPGTLIQNRYEVVGLIGKGGMGAVYEAIDRRLRSTVALKQTLVTEERLFKAFEREAQILASLRHTALTRVSDHFTDEQGQFLVMDFIPGEDLGKLLEQRGQPFPLDDVILWGDTILDALDYLHTQPIPIIHRDIKPQNLKLTPRGEIIILDFGLAKGSTSLQQSRITSGGSIFGYTPRYAPLEQIQGTGTGPRSDLYALAATLYHLLTGASPSDALRRASAVLNDQPDPLQPAHEVNPHIPQAISDVLMAAMSLGADGRPPDAITMRRYLRSAYAQVSPEGAAALPPLVRPAPSTPASPLQKPPDAPAYTKETIALPGQEQAAARSASSTPSPPGTPPPTPVNIGKPAGQSPPPPAGWSTVPPSPGTTPGGAPMPPPPTAWTGDYPPPPPPAKKSSWGKYCAFSAIGCLLLLILAVCSILGGLTIIGQQVREESEAATATAWAQQRPTRATTAGVPTVNVPTVNVPTVNLPVPTTPFDELFSETAPPETPPDVPPAWTTLVADTFDNNTNGWATGIDDDEWSLGHQWIEDGAYQWDVLAYQDFVWRVHPATVPLSDFALSVDAQQFEGPGETVYFGLVFRYSRQDEMDNYYTFTIANDQTYHVGLVHQDEWFDLTEWEGTSLIDPEGVNNLAMTAQGSTFSFMINGEEVATLEDATLQEGKVGLIIGLDEGDEARFGFDNFTLLTPPEVLTPVPMESIDPHIPFALTFSDTFDEENFGWDFGEFEDEWSSGTQYLLDGRYRWDALGLQDYIWWGFPSEQRFADFAATVEGRRVEGPYTNSEYGLLFRYQQETNSFYAFRVTDRQTFKVSFSANEEWETLIDWTTSPVIRPGEMNQVGVIAEGSRFRFFINGHPVGEVSDERLPEGFVGIFTSGGEGEEAIFEFDTVEIYAP